MRLELLGGRFRHLALILSGLLVLHTALPASAAAERGGTGNGAKRTASAPPKASPKAPAARAMSAQQARSASQARSAPQARGQEAGVRASRTVTRSEPKSARNGPAAARAAAASARGGRAVRVSHAPRTLDPPRLSLGQAIGLHLVEDPLDLRSSVAMVIDQRTGQPMFEKNADAVLPIASITKVMTAMVVLDAALPMEEQIEITSADRDTERFSSSRLPIGARLSRGELMQLALMASDNRAAHALGRTYPAGQTAFVAAMNDKAAAIGMSDSRFSDPTGLSSGNVSNARDLARLVRAAHGYPRIRQYSTADDLTVSVGARQVTFRNTNRLIHDEVWDIGLQKTGYISEAGKCLVMQARIDGRPVIMVLLDATATQSRFADAQRLRRWVEQQPRSTTSSGQLAPPSS